MAKPKLDNVLAGVPLFEGLSKRHLKKLGSLAEMADFMEGASVVKEGAAGRQLLRGDHRAGEGHREGRTVHRVLPGDHFGEISLIDGGDRTATVLSRNADDPADDRSQALPEDARGRPRCLGLAAGESGAHDPPGRPFTRPVACCLMKVEFYPPRRHHPRTSPTPRPSPPS